MSAGAELTVERVSVAFRGLQALNAVSVSAGAGEITALVGPNGAGKTTLLNAISGFCAITAGSIPSTGRRSTGCRRTGSRPGAWGARSSSSSCSVT